MNTGNRLFTRVFENIWNLELNDSISNGCRRGSRSTAQQYGGECTLLYKEIPQLLHTSSMNINCTKNDLKLRNHVLNKRTIYLEW